MAICLVFLAAQTYSFRANTVPRGNVIGVGGGGRKNVQGCVQMRGRGRRLPFFPPFSLHAEHEAKFMDDKWHSSRKTPPPSQFVGVLGALLQGIPPLMRMTLA